MNLSAAQQMTDSGQSHPDKPANAAEASSAEEASPSPPLGRNSGLQAKRAPCRFKVMKSNVWLAQKGLSVLSHLTSQSMVLQGDDLQGILHICTSLHDT